MLWWQNHRQNIQGGSATFTGLFHIILDMDTNESQRDWGCEHNSSWRDTFFIYTPHYCRSIMHENGVSETKPKSLAWWKKEWPFDICLEKIMKQLSVLTRNKGSIIEWCQTPLLLLVGLLVSINNYKTHHFALHTFENMLHLNPNVSLDD